MALITCPHCGKKVSDSTNICIHCGNYLERELKSYNDLTATEKEELKAEFEADNPHEASNIADKKKKASLMKKIHVVTEVSWIVFIAITALLYFTGSENLEAMLFFGISGFVLLEVSYVTDFLRKRSEAKIIRISCAAKKRYALWLEKEKNIAYDPALTKEEKMVYDSVDPYKETGYEKSRGKRKIFRKNFSRKKRSIVAQEFEDNANEFVSDVTESAIVVQSL